MEEFAEMIKFIASICVVLVSLGGGFGIILKLLNHYSSYKEFKKKCEAYEKEIFDTNARIEDAHKYAIEALEQIQADTDAKLQEIRAEQCMITYCMSAVLDGLHQLNCNGPVTEARNKLDKYLNKQAHQLKEDD